MASNPSDINSDINSQENFWILAVFLSFLVTMVVILAASSALEDS